MFVLFKTEPTQEPVAGRGVRAVNASMGTIEKIGKNDCYNDFSFYYSRLG